MPSKKKRLTMGAVIILPTANHEWGMWGASLHNGYDPNVTWTAASRFLAETFRLKPEQVRDLLDARFGRHLADDLSFIPQLVAGTFRGGPADEEIIASHLAARFAQPAWRDWVRITLGEIKRG
ncbi:MAG: hypothetical protein A3G18_09680 [Rhodospirillales bacterium RIFCSPLOWO2_12_FULL_58_28]|nr:MAG: hypothetical protein A3H92_06230 [Rhodospirillales bacterium RIFCSPLOWO2_02_FULL_58_16]OHC78771.1 MAG: hypothetical protein A3G18_09680 [Rhodospirillales bacterium RIFCSPLOWO2_12_FULL_58_28]